MATKLPPETYLSLWQKAEEAEFGLCVQVVPEDQMKLVNALYECRQTCSGFEGMIVMQPEPKGQVWIMHKNVELPE